MTDATEGTKSQLARAARDVLLEEGLAGLSMRRVAKACGLSATAIYRHYSDKDALVARAVLDGFRIFGSYLMDALEKRTPLARFRCMLRRYLDFALENPQYYRLMFMTDCEQLGMVHLDEVSKREVSGTFQMLADRIADGQRSGAFKSGKPRALAASVWASIHGLASLLLTGNLGETKQDVESLCKLQLAQIEAGLSA